MLTFFIFVLYITRTQNQKEITHGRQKKLRSKLRY